MKLQRQVLGLSILALSLSACSATKFTSTKQTTLSSKSAFGGGESQDGAPGNGIANGVINQPADNNEGSANGSINQPGSADGLINQILAGAGSADGRIPSTEPGNAHGSIHQPDGTDDEIDFLLMCSDNRSQRSSNFKHAVANGLPVQLLIGDKVCTSNINAIKSLIAKKSFTIADAKTLCPALVPVVGTWSNVSLNIDGTSVEADRGSITVLYALNKGTTPANEAADALCDQRSSPLVIHIASDVANPQPIALSSQDDGIWFDLLGSRNNDDKVRISWFTNQEYGVLVLPDVQGQVNGIDQLFGNSTIGPDGRYSENGYEALAKYDGTSADGIFNLSAPDDRIDANDAVFKRLRLWVDANRDGVAQATELITLRRAHIAYIDLDYSNDFKETDQYGNQTLMKSVVGLSDGSLDLIFDLWFAYRF